jgi:hypothetical protein
MIFSGLLLITDSPSEDNIGFEAYDDPFYLVISLHYFQACDSNLRQK